MNPKKLIGEISWHELGDYEEVEIERAILRDDGKSLVLDFRYDGRRHLLEMKRGADNQFSGSAQQSTGKETWQIQATAKLYSYGANHVLVGRWRETELYKFIVELEETDHFPDELSKA